MNRWLVFSDWWLVVGFPFSVLRSSLSVSRWRTYRDPSRSCGNAGLPARRKNQPTRIRSVNVPCIPCLPWFLLSAITSTTAPAQPPEPTPWTVPATSPPFAIEVEGQVEMSRASVQTIRPGCPEAVVTWIGPDGKNAAFGDILMTFDTTAIQRRHAFGLDELRLLREQNAKKILTLQKAIADAEEELARKLETLRSREASARATAAPDPSRVATLRREIDLARRNAALQEADLQRLRNLHQLGETSRVELEDAELQTDAIRRAITEAELALTEAGDGSDPVLARRAQWLVERTRTGLGVTPDGEVDESSGEGKKLTKLRASLKRLRTSAATAIHAQETEVQEFAQIAWPNLPLRQLWIQSADGTPILNQYATNETLAATYDPDLGFGWLTSPTLSATPSPNPDKPPAVDTLSPALVIQDQATWQIDLPPGDYHIGFELGDNVEWNCMVIQAEGTAAKRVGDLPHHPLVAINRLEPNELKTVQAAITIPATNTTGLRLHLGLPERALLASEAGAIKNQSWLRLGRRIRGNPPALYLTPEAKVLGRFRVHHLRVPFFQAPDPAIPLVARTIDLLDSRGQWIPGGTVKVTDEPTVFFPENVQGYGDQPEPPPAEKTAREVTVSVPEAFTANFPFAAHLRCRATVSATTNAFVVPAHLVHADGAGFLVNRVGTTNRATRVKGVRFDDRVLVTSGLAPGDQLLPPKKPAARSDTRATGEIIAAAAVPIIVPTRSWARIESLLPHGSPVKKDDLVVTLYRPKEASRHMKSRAKAVEAESTFQDAIDEQQKAFLTVRDAHAQALQRERLAADKVSENRRLDAADLERAAEAQRAVRAELDVLERRVAQLAGRESTRLAHEDARRRRDLLRLQSRARALDEVATRRAGDATQHLDDTREWQKARADLDRQTDKIKLNLQRQDALAQKARTSLENARVDEQDANDFETLRKLTAPADGHVFYENGYNDLARRRERLDKEFVVWNGLTIARILDISNLSFKLQFPETAYHLVRLDMEFPIEFEDLDGRTLTGTVAEIGRVLQTSRTTVTAPESIGIRRVFDVTLRFPVPDDLREKLRPGLRGSVALPTQNFP